MRMTSATRTGRPIRGRRDLSRLDAEIHRRPQSLVAIARTLIEHARRRSAFLPGAKFEDPQWMMMLDLFIAAEEKRSVSVTSLCMAACIPPTTALRHIRYLEKQGLFERVSHPNDKRISLVRLSEAARGQVARYLISLSPTGMSGMDHPALRLTY